ncbi:MAG: hypothetical protein JWO09_2633 [Bacteroidetes bacterium]|nr:hypothetical protein [Bacteroidota bacterium]
MSGQTIPPLFFGQNAWMADTLGDIENCSGKPYGINCKLYGKINQNNTWERVRQSGVKLIRFGGEHADQNMPTRRQYIQVIDSARSKGIEPLLQVPYNNNVYTADTAAALVKFINVTMKRNVKYWSIGNEPDLEPPNGYGYYTASPVADYTRQFAVKMKAVDSTIITLGPELTYYDDRNHLITELTTPGGFYDITGKVPGHSYYYLDIITFHSYPYGGNQTRAELVSNLRDPWHISHMLDLLSARLDTCNNYHHRGEHALKIALTETNLNYRNSPDPELDAHSFLAGQFWCELMGVGMEKGLAFIAFWSVIEVSLGYIDERTGKLWPTYHHYKLMTDNIKGNYYKSEITGANKDLKVIAAADSNYITVMLLNQKNSKSSYKYSIQLGNGTITGTGDVQIRIKDLAGLDSTFVYSDSIEDESTGLLVFDYSGRLVKKYSYKKSDGPNAVPKLVKGAVMKNSAKIN